MSLADRHQVLSALALLVMALIVACAYPPAARWRRHLRIGAVVLFGVALVWVLVEISLWWAAATR